MARVTKEEDQNFTKIYNSFRRMVKVRGINDSLVSLTANDKELYSYLRSWDRSCNKVYMTIYQMTIDLGINKATVLRSVTKLESIGLISVNREGKNNSYTTKYYEDVIVEWTTNERSSSFFGTNHDMKGVTLESSCTGTEDCLCDTCTLPF